MRESLSPDGLQRTKAGTGAQIWADAPEATGRCEVCMRLTYGGERLCKICRPEMAYDMELKALGLSSGRCAETRESRALHRWMRRQERREKLRGIGYLALVVGVYAAVGYIVCRFGMMFVAWIAGRP